MLVPIPASFCVHSPVKTFIWAPTRFRFDLRAHIPRTEFFVTCSKTVLLVKRLKTPNSNVRVPPPAVDVILLSFSSTPYNKLTDPNGILCSVLQSNEYQTGSSASRYHSK
uniref:Uncharacterized protein n=1 Tax=Arundo donax TaxID=35708 RepID=A0A0A9D8P9_ARUDO